MPDVMPCWEQRPHARHNWEEQSHESHRRYHVCWGIPEKAELPEVVRKDIADFIAAYSAAQEEISKTLAEAVVQFSNTITLRSQSAESKLAEVRAKLTGIMTNARMDATANSVLAEVFQIVEFIDKGEA